MVGCFSLRCTAPNVFKRIAAWSDGWTPIRVTPEQVKMRRATLDELAKTAGRDPKSICSVPPGRDTIMRLEEAEADRVTLSLPRDMGDKVLTELEAMAKQVLY